MTKKEKYNLISLTLLLAVIMAVGGSFSGNFILGILGFILIIILIPARIITWWKYYKELYSNYRIIKEKLKKEKRN